MADLEYEVDSGVATIRLNRPAQRNAFTLPMLQSWVAALTSARDDDDVRVVVLTGAPGAFCSGVDLSAVGADDSPLQTKSVLTDHVHRVALAVEDLDKPLIAAVNGPAVGAGMGNEPARPKRPGLIPRGAKRCCPGRRLPGRATGFPRPARRAVARRP